MTKKRETITSMNFVKSVIIDGRPVEGLSTEYEAEVIDFPWIAVWPKGDPKKVRLTTVFNVRDRQPLLESETGGTAKPASS